LKLQQENKDRENKLVVSKLEEKVNELENLLEEKDSKIKTVEADLAEAHLRIENQATQISNQDKQLKRQNIELEKVNSNLKEVGIRFEHEINELKDEVKAEAEKSSKLYEALKMLRDTYSGFATRCSLRLREIFNSIGVMPGKANYSADDIPKALEFVEKEIKEFDKVMVWHGDFCALVVARVTATIFAKAGCKHLKNVNKPTFTISPADFENIPSEA
jgi:chromosome segregation ATPase